MRWLYAPPTKLEVEVAPVWLTIFRYASFFYCAIVLSSYSTGLRRPNLAKTFGPIEVLVRPTVHTLTLHTDYRSGG